MKNIWILTEERPKISVVQTILDIVATDHNFSVLFSDLRIIPVFKDGLFTFSYRVGGLSSEDFGHVYITLASGSSSFVDFLIFLQEKEPAYSDQPLYAIEETKTDDSESRNTGVYQRCTKFIYIDFFYPNIKKIMLYSLMVVQKEQPSQTNIFGMRMLRTMGVEVIGKVYQEEFKAFSSLEELAQIKNEMRMPPKGNVPIKIEVQEDKITISGRLFKSGRMGHDPNIGALTAIAYCIRKWEKEKDIVIILHGLEQLHVVTSNNKFIHIAKRLNIKLAGLDLPEVKLPKEYWHYENSQEKIVTIFLDILLAEYTDAEIVYSNHGGTERSYFIPKEGGFEVIKKYQEGMKERYKSGEKDLVIRIPDLIVYDPKREEIINIEGKKFCNKKAGIEELDNYGYIENNSITPSYEPKNILRTVVLFGSDDQQIGEEEVSLLLNNKGQVVLGSKAPEIFKEALERVLLT